MSEQALALTGESSPHSESEYHSILDAVMETGRGRWFLHEYARRHRNVDTGTLLAAIDRIESMLKSPGEETPAEPPAIAAAAGTHLDHSAPPALDPDIVPELQALIGPLREIAANLLECGAPTYLCNDLNRRIDQLAGHVDRASRPRDAADNAQPREPVQPVEPAPVADSGLSEMLSAELALAERLVTQARTADASPAADAPDVAPKAAESPAPRIPEAPPKSEPTRIPGARTTPEPRKPEAPRRDPFADLAALSPEERIALFT